MPRPQAVYVCNACHGESLKWQGQCPACGEWNSLTHRAVTGVSRPGPAGAAPLLAATALAALEEGPAEARWSLGQSELDRVFGGGLLPGSVTLLGGEPGIGKSTLLLQVAASIAAGVGQLGLDRSVLYVSGEESPSQVAMRARRLELDTRGLQAAAETDLDSILALASPAGSGRQCALLVIDSIQTMTRAGVESSAGSVSQLRECTAALVRHAKSTGTAVVIVGHVTKEGAIAGPRLLEHLVDTVLYFERDPGSRFRMIRATKNRFGNVNELGFFHMTGTGLREVRNPSAIFLARSAQAVPGSVVMVARDGTRPLLVEVQALVDRMRFGNPRRVAQGLDANRLSMLIAVLSRHAEITLQEHDVFANVVGGLDISETAWDLPVALALASSLRGQALPQDLVVFGEVGLTGELRPVSFGEERLKEAAKQGFARALVARDNAPRGGVDGILVRGVSRVADAVEAAFQPAG